MKWNACEAARAYGYKLHALTPLHTQVVESSAASEERRSMGREMKYGDVPL
jgi:hypothetical protein